MTNGEFSGSSTSSTRPVSHGSATDAGAYPAGSSGSVSSASAPYNSTQTNNDPWNDRPTSVHAGYSAETGASYQYSSVVPPSQRRPQSQHSNNVQEYVLVI